MPPYRKRTTEQFGVMADGDSARWQGGLPEDDFTWQYVAPQQKTKT